MTFLARPRSRQTVFPFLEASRDKVLGLGDDITSENFQQTTHGIIMKMVGPYAHYHCIRKNKHFCWVATSGEPNDSQLSYMETILCVIE